MKSLRTIFAVLVILAELPLWAATVDVHAIARGADEHYNHLKTLKAEFTQIYEGGGISRSESGTVWLKKPGRMRWEYSRPRRKLFVTNAESAFFYVPGERQAHRTPVKRLDDLRSPLRYLLGKTRLEKELNGLSLAPDVAPITPGNTVLRGVPRGMKDRIGEVLLEITPTFRISRIVLREVDGSTMDFRFSSPEEDLPMPDSLFRFKPGPGIEVIDDQQISQ